MISCMFLRPELRRDLWQRSQSFTKLKFQICATWIHWSSIQHRKSTRIDSEPHWNDTNRSLESKSHTGKFWSTGGTRFRCSGNPVDGFPQILAQICKTGRGPLSPDIPRWTQPLEHILGPEEERRICLKKILRHQYCYSQSLSGIISS